MGPSVLVVDDDAAFRGLAARVLARWGHRVVGDAATVADGLGETARLGPDVVLADITLPDGDGFALTRALRAWPRPPRVVLVSADPDAADARAAARVGAAGFVAKAALAGEVLRRLVEDGALVVADPAALPVRGRGTELDALDGLLRGTDAGTGAALLVEGAAGIGRTRLLAEACARAAALGLRVVAGRAAEARGGVPFALLLDVLRRGDAPLVGEERLASLTRRADLRYWLVEEAQAALEAAAMRRPLALVLDDLHWADPASLVALADLVQRSAALPVAWVLAAREHAAPPALARLRARLDQDGRRLVLGPLDDDAVAAVVRDRLTARADPRLLALAATAQGTPAALLEVLLGLGEEGRLVVSGGRATAVGDAPPARLVKSAAERLAELGRDARELVRAAALAGEAPTPALLAAVLDRRPSELAPALREALGAGLLIEQGDGLAFRPAVLRAAVAGTVPDATRRALQRRTADALLERGAAPAEVASLIAASAAPGDDAAVAGLVRAAQTLAAADPGVAADLGLRALTLLDPADARRPALVADTLGHLHAALRPDEARELAATALAGRLAPEAEAQVRLRLSALMLRPPAERARENRAALALDGLAPATRARHLAMLAHTLAAAGQVGEAALAAPAAERAARSARDAQATVLALLARAGVEEHHGRLARAAALVAEASDQGHGLGVPLSPGFVEFQQAGLLHARGATAEALALVGEGIERGRRDRQAWLVAGWVQTAAPIRLAAGAIADALADVDAAAALVEEVAPTALGAAAAMLARVEVALHAGDAAGRRAALAVARGSLAASPAIRRHAAWALALDAARRGRPAEAVALLADDELPYAVPFAPAEPARHPRVARLAVAAGDPELAARAVAVAEAMHRDDPANVLLAGLAAHARGVAEHDAATVLAAAGQLDGGPRPLAAALAHEDAAALVAATGHDADAARALHRAHALHLAAGATADARRTARALRALGVRDVAGPADGAARGWAALTASELRVVRLVAAGATNREVAAELFLSPHTVNSHLVHAYAKLGVRSRVQLVRAALEQGEGPQPSSTSATTTTAP